MFICIIIFCTVQFDRKLLKNVYYLITMPGNKKAATSRSKAKPNAKTKKKQLIKPKRGCGFINAEIKMLLELAKKKNYHLPTMNAWMYGILLHGFFITSSLKWKEILILSRESLIDWFILKHQLVIRIVLQIYYGQKNQGKD